MKRSYWYIVVCCATVMVGSTWAYWRHAGRVVPDTASVEDRVRDGGTTIAQVQQAFGPVKQGIARSTDRNISGETHLTSTPRSNGARCNGDREVASRLSDTLLTTGSLEMDGLSVPEGAPFPVSESIERECANWDSARDAETSCSRTYLAIKRIEEERSDVQWATSMESRIRMVLSADPGVRIRALACRSSVCAVETEGSRVVSAWVPLHKDLLMEDQNSTFEDIGNHGERLRVTLTILKRRKS